MVIYPFKVMQLVGMMRGIAYGMQYLAEMNYVHRKGSNNIHLITLFLSYFLCLFLFLLLSLILLLLFHSLCLSVSLFLVMTSIAQLIKTSAYVCTGRNPVRASVVFLNELIISRPYSPSLFYSFSIIIRSR